MDGIKLEPVSEPIELPKGLFWVPKTSSLYFIDIYQSNVHRFETTTKTLYTAKVGTYSYCWGNSGAQQRRIDQSIIISDVFSGLIVESISSSEISSVWASTIEFSFSSTSVACSWFNDAINTWKCFRRISNFLSTCSFTSYNKTFYAKYKFIYITYIRSYAYVCIMQMHILI